MVAQVIMPQGGQDIEAGTIVRWHRNAGEAVKKGEVICEVETEKTVLEVTAPQDGVVLKTFYAEGEEAKVFSVIALVGNDAGWTQIAREQVDILGDDVGTALARSDYDRVAQGFGAAGFRLDDPEAAPVPGDGGDAAGGGRGPQPPPADRACPRALRLRRGPRPDGATA